MGSERMLKRAEKAGRRFLNPVTTGVGGPGMMVKAMRQYLTNREERVPAKPLGPFRTAVAVYDTVPASGLRVTWFGHSASLVEMDGVRLLIDPVWDERASPAQWFGPKRFFAPTMTLEEMPRLDAVLISHDHYDHLGAGTVRRLAALRPAMRWICPVGVAEVLHGFGVGQGRVTELDWTESTVVHGAELGAGMTLTALPARHFSGRSLWNRFQTLWASFVLKSAQHSVYYGADSGPWPGFAEIGAAYGPFDLVMMEIGAYNALWGDIHLGPDGAVQAFEELGGTGLLMPVHWGLFDLALHGWRQPIEQIVRVTEQRGHKLWSPEPGRAEEVLNGVEVRPEWWRKEGDAEDRAGK